MEKIIEDIKEREIKLESCHDETLIEELKEDYTELILMTLKQYMKDKEVFVTTDRSITWGFTESPPLYCSIGFDCYELFLINYDRICRMIVDKYDGRGTFIIVNVYYGNEIFRVGFTMRRLEN